MNIAELKIIYLEKAKSLSNRDLFEQAFNLAQPDDYDGVFTKNGLAEYEAYRIVLEERLASWMEE